MYVEWGRGPVRSGTIKLKEISPEWERKVFEMLKDYLPPPEPPEEPVWE